MVRDMYHGFDYRTALGGTPQQRLVMMAGAIEWILDKQQQWAAAETTEEGKKAQRRYQDTVLACHGYALASATDEARAVREEVGFPGHPRVLGQKRHGLRCQFAGARPGHPPDCQPRGDIDRDRGHPQGRRHPVSGHLHPVRRVPAEVQQMEKKNLALEALRKLVNDGIRSRSKSNIVQQGTSTRLEESIARYHANAITTAEVLQELIQIAKDIRAARARGRTGPERRRDRLL